MSAGIFMSRILGFIRDMTIGYYFSRTETDAFFVAFRFPNFFRRFLGESALSVSFIPTFIDYLHQPGVAEEKRVAQAKNLMNSVYTVLLITVSTVTVLGIYFMDHIILWMFGSHSFSTVEGKIEMTTLLSRALFSYLFLVVNYAYLTAVANAFRRFFIPAVAPAAFNLSVISSVLFLPKGWFPFPSMSLAVGVLIGGLLQVMILAYTLYHLNFLPSLRFSFKEVKVVLKKFIPSVIGIGGFALIGMLNVYYAGWLDEGVHTYIYYADRLLELPRALVAVSMGATLLPFLSKLHTQGEFKALVKTAADQRDLLLYIIVPCGLGLFFLGTPIIEVLFVRGKFDQWALRHVVEVLEIYSLLLIFLALIQVLSTCYFVIKNTWYPALSTLSGLLFHVCFAPLLISYAQLEGLILSTTLAALIQLSMLLLAYPYFIGSLRVKKTLLRLLKLAPIWLVFVFYIKYTLLILTFLLDFIFPQNLALTFALFITLFSSIILYLYVGILFKMRQAVACINLFKGRLKPEVS